MEREIMLTTPEASQLTGLGKTQLARLCREGKIEGERRGRDWFLSRRSLVAYMGVWHPEKQLDQGRQES